MEFPDVNLTPRERQVFKTSETRRVQIVKSKQEKGTHNLFLQAGIYEIDNPNCADKSVINQLVKSDRINSKQEVLVFEDCV